MGFIQAKLHARSDRRLWSFGGLSGEVSGLSGRVGGVSGEVGGGKSDRSDLSDGSD